MVMYVLIWYMDGQIRQGFMLGVYGRRNDNYAIRNGRAESDESLSFGNGSRKKCISFSSAG